MMPFCIMDDSFDVASRQHARLNGPEGGACEAKDASFPLVTSARICVNYFFKFRPLHSARLESRGHAMTVSSATDASPIQPQRLLFGRSRVRIRSSTQSRDQKTDAPSVVTAEKPSAVTLGKVTRLREALTALKAAEKKFSIRSSGSTSAPIAATVTSASLAFQSPAATTLESVEEINTAPTSFTRLGPNIVGSTATAPWSGLGSTSDATVTGSYDGSNGSETLTFVVDKEGTHGVDDLQVKVFAGGTQIEQIDIDKEHPLNKVYALSNGLNVTFGTGDLVKDDQFVVDTTLLTTSFTPGSPDWQGSTADPTIGGFYLGTNGSGTLTFVVDREGTHGEDDLEIDVFAPDDTFIETINVKKNDAIDKLYGLSNGLTFSLSEGDLIKGETFTVNVDAVNPFGTGPTQPEWNVSTATASIAGTYDGSLGTGTVLFRVDNEGTRGVDDLKIKVYAPDGSFIEDLDIDKDDPIDATYLLASGLTLSLGAGDLIRNETFTVDVVASTSFSTTPHAVESTAEVTLGGVYDGSQGTGELTFYFTQGGEHGTDDLSVELRESDGTVIETISVAQTDPTDTVYLLSNGLTFQLGAGSLTQDESFSISVNHQIGTRVDPDKAFDGVRNDNAQFDVGLSITAGSFDVNGVTVDVYANDTLNTVLDRITQSTADVTAAFDAATETVKFTRNTIGEDHGITFANDTSGFVAAAKLDGAVAVNVGNTTSTAIGETDVLSSVLSGTFQVNGVSISIDVSTDSFEDIVERINTSGT